MNFMVIRKGILVYFASGKIRQEVEKVGVNIVYFNEKRNYLAGYVDATQFERIKKQLETMKNVRKVEESLLDMEPLNFQDQA